MKEKMNDAIEKYTDYKLKQTVNVSRETYQIIYDKYHDNDGPMGRFADNMFDAIQEIKAGKHITQIEQIQYGSLYSNLNFSNPNSFRQSYEKVMEGYEKIQKQHLGSHWNNTSQDQTEINIQLLRDDWNSFVSKVTSLTSYKVFSNNSLVVDNRV